jgi:hypothetical protein
MQQFASLRDTAALRKPLHFPSRTVVNQPLKKFSAFYKTRRFITTFIGPYREAHELGHTLITLLCSTAAT